MQVFGERLWQLLPSLWDYIATPLKVGAPLPFMCTCQTLDARNTAAWADLLPPACLPLDTCLPGTGPNEASGSLKSSEP